MGKLHTPYTLENCIESMHVRKSNEIYGLERCAG